MTKLHTHYDNLKITRDAPMSVIKASYKVLAQENHPDRCKYPDAPRRMQILNDAYAQLSDPIKRAEHDSWIKSKESATDLESNLQAQYTRLRSLHRSDIYQIRQDHAREVNSLISQLRIERKLGKTMGIILGLIISIPVNVAIYTATSFIQPAQAESAPQQAKQEAPMLGH